MSGGPNGEVPPELRPQKRVPLGPARRTLEAILAEELGPRAQLAGQGVNAAKLQVRVWRLLFDALDRATAPQIDPAHVDFQGVSPRDAQILNGLAKAGGGYVLLQITPGADPEEAPEDGEKEGAGG